MRVTPHQRATLLVSARALARRALQPIPSTTRLPIFCRLVSRTGGIGSRAPLFRVAFARGGAADCVCGGELAVGAALLVAVIAHSAIAEGARRRVATGVVPTARLAPAIALLAWFYDAITALLARDEIDVTVVAEAVCADRIAPNGGADVADAAGAEVGDAVACGGVHDVALAGIAGVG